MAASHWPDRSAVTANAAAVIPLEQAPSTVTPEQLGAAMTGADDAHASEPAGASGGAA